jgi:hypothetical protein
MPGDTHFGFEQVPAGEKARKVADVFGRSRRNTT